MDLTLEAKAFTGTVVSIDAELRKMYELAVAKHGFKGDYDAYLQTHDMAPLQVDTGKISLGDNRFVGAAIIPYEMRHAFADKVGQKVQGTAYLDGNGLVVEKMRLVV